MIRPLLCSTLLLSGLPQHASAQDTLTVKVRDDPVWGAHPQLVEELRIGAMEGDPDYTFGVVAGVATDADGTLWVSDRLFGTLRRYTREGRHIDDVGRKGKGPGEFNYLMDLRRLPNGNVAVWDPINTRIHIFQPDGTFARDITVPVPGMFGLPQNFEVDSAGRFYAISMDFPEARRSGPLHAYWIRLSNDGAIVDTVQYRPGNQDGLYEPLRSATAVSPLGYQVWGRNDRYEFFSRRPDGTVVRLAGSPKRVPYQRTERAEAQRFEEVFAERNGKSARRVPREKPVWRSFTIDAEGRLWVDRYVEGVHVDETESERAPRERSNTPPRRWTQPLSYDVLEPGGRFLGTLTFPNSATATPVPRIQVALARGEQVWTVERGEFDEQYVVRYRVVPDSRDP